MTERIGSSFERRAAGYDNALTAYIGERELRAIRKLVPPCSSLLDYGCGTGRSALDHARRGCQVTAYDLSPNMLSFAESKARRDGLEVEFTADKELLANRKWQLVTCIGVFDYYPDPGPLLKELDQYLEEDGRLVLTWPNALSPLGWFYFVVSRFTVPSTPRTPRFVRKAAGEVGFQVCSLLYAFPAWSPLGFTLVVEMRRYSPEYNPKVLPQ
jgi:SAM-dependent methyltransferase